MKDIISKRRKELGMTQQELADKIFVSDKVISKWETGKSVPDTVILVDLANALDITVNDLLNVDNTSRINVKEADYNMVSRRYVNILIIFLAIQLSACIFLGVGRILYYSIYEFSYIIIFVGILSQIGAITYFIVNRNNVLFQYSSAHIIDKKYIPILLHASIVMVLVLVYIFTRLQVDGHEFLLCFALFSLPFIIGYIILLIWNKKR